MTKAPNWSARLLALAASSLFLALLLSCSTSTTKIAPPSENWVHLEFEITEEGSVANPRVVESTDPELNEEALRAISKWKYKPSSERREGQQVILQFD